MIAEISPTSPVLVWFRKDLRLQDNPSLNAALEADREIIPLFVWDEEEGGKWLKQEDEGEQIYDV